MIPVPPVVIPRISPPLPVGGVPELHQDFPLLQFPKCGQVNFAVREGGSWWFMKYVFMSVDVSYEWAPEGDDKYW